MITSTAPDIYSFEELSTNQISFVENDCFPILPENAVLLFKTNSSLDLYIVNPLKI